eukprot:scaffold7602_cov123-Isochrysis_galbana.AAC.10
MSWGGKGRAASGRGDQVGGSFRRRWRPLVGSWAPSPTCLRDGGFASPAEASDMEMSHVRKGVCFEYRASGSSARGVLVYWKCCIAVVSGTGSRTAPRRRAAVAFKATHARTPRCRRRAARCSFSSALSASIFFTASNTRTRLCKRMAARRFFDCIARCRWRRGENGRRRGRAAAVMLAWYASFIDGFIPSEPEEGRPAVLESLLRMIVRRIYFGTICAVLFLPPLTGPECELPCL